MRWWQCRINKYATETRGALNALKLPIKVKAGFLGSVKLKAGGLISTLPISYKISAAIFVPSVPWSRIGQEPVLVYLDRIYLLAEPETQVEGYSEDAVQKTKRSRIHVRHWHIVHCCIIFDLRSSKNVQHSQDGVTLKLQQLTLIGGCMFSTGRHMKHGSCLASEKIFLLSGLSCMS
ncbi:pleckstrin domain superfamily protein [Tanacetum coccineum]